MADLYSTLQVSPRKKRYPSEDSDVVLSPKKLRMAPPTPPKTVSRKGKKQATPALVSLPDHLSRLNTIYSGLQQAMSHALATCAISPSSDRGYVRNVLNHLSLTTYTGLTAQFDVNDLRRLCWLWEWDGKTLPAKSDNKLEDEDEDNPFLESSETSSQPKEWTRGAMGIIISPTTHHSRSSGKRVPAYGIGIEVEMNIDRNMGGGMAAVARWTAAGESRRKDFRKKLDRWVTLHAEEPAIPTIPLADLPSLPRTQTASSLTLALVAASPKSRASISTLEPPSSPGRSPSKSPAKKLAVAREIKSLPTLNLSPTKSTKSTVLFPSTPSSRRIQTDPAASLLTPHRTPAHVLTNDASSDLFTPRQRKGPDAETAPQTPTTSRRQAIYERVRLRSLSKSPTKARAADLGEGKLTKEQMMKMGQDEMRRRCLLGRLGGVAESVWMLFSAPASSSITSTPSSRKRKARPMSEVVPSIVKSSPVPMSSAEAQESLVMLTELCPFFLRQMDIAGEDWLEMPASSTSSSVATSASNSVDATPTRGRTSTTVAHAVTASPRSKKLDSSEQLVTRSPRTVKKESGGLREVREIIRKELELQD